MGITLHSQSLYVLHIKLNPALNMLAQLYCELFTSSDDASEKRTIFSPTVREGKCKNK